jgi:drug/metabolite transporter (DMT)-like permease
MYFWQTNKLIDDLKNNRLTQTHFKNYYLGSAILMLIGIFILNISPETNLRYGLAEFICQVGVLITAVNAIYKANGGEKGTDFLNRLVALYFPITIKMSVLGIAVGVVIGVILQLSGLTSVEGQSTMIEDLTWLVLTILITALSYWRIYVAMQNIQRH